MSIFSIGDYTDMMARSHKGLRAIFMPDLKTSFAKFNRTYGGRERNASQVGEATHYESPYDEWIMSLH